MKETSIFVTLLTIATLLPCRGAPIMSKPTVSLKQPSSLNTVKQSQHTLIDKPSCNRTGVKPASFVMESKIYSERRLFIQMTQDGLVHGTTKTLSNTYGEFYSYNYRRVWK